MLRNILRFVIVFLLFASGSGLEAQDAPRDTSTKRVCYTSGHRVPPDTTPMRIVVRSAPPCGVDTTRSNTPPQAARRNTAGPRANTTRSGVSNPSSQAVTTSPQRVEVALSTDTLVVKSEVTVHLATPTTSTSVTTGAAVVQPSWFYRHRKGLTVSGVLLGAVSVYCIVEKCFKQETNVVVYNY